MKNSTLFNFEKQSFRFLFILLITDLLFLIIHGFCISGVIPNINWSIEKEGGYAELYQYIKELWIFLFLLIVAIKDKRLIYFAWSLLFFYFLIDDALAFHEKVGNYLAQYINFEPPFGLRINDVGELLATAFFGFFFLVTIYIAYRYSNLSEKKISKHLLIFVSILVFFGVILDMLHVAIEYGKSIWGIFEDGGEMIIMSIILWYVFGLQNGPKDAPVIE